MKPLILLSLMCFCILNTHSQAFIQGYSVMFGKGKAKSNSPSFSNFNSNYFVKLKFGKALYLKANAGLGFYNSTNDELPYIIAFDNQTGNTTDLVYSRKYRSTYLPLTIGSGIDFRIKNFSFGINFQKAFGIRNNDNKLEEWENQLASETIPGTSMYRYNFYTNTILPATNIANSFSYSIDLEYTFKKFGIKYSYLIASQRPISQFGITYNLMYDWRIVNE